MADNLSDLVIAFKNIYLYLYIFNCHVSLLSLRITVRFVSQIQTHIVSSKSYF